MINTNYKNQAFVSPADITAALSNYDIDAIRHYQKHVKKPHLGHIPGSEGLPLVGTAIPMLLNLHQWINTQQARHGNVFRVKMPTLNGVMLLGPDANRIVFQNESKIFSNYLAWEKSFRNLFDNNLLERDFSDHKRLRKTLQIAFKREAIEGHMEIMNPMLKVGISQWPPNQTIKVMGYLKELLLNTGSAVFLGAELGDDIKKINNAFNDIVAATADLFHLQALWFSPYAKGVRAKALLSQFIFQNIPEHRKRRSRSLLSQFCHLTDDSGHYFSDNEIRDQILFVLFAAHDTTTSALSAVLYALASNPHWQDQVREEMLAIGKDNLEFTDLDSLEKCEWTIKEALRMYPALSMMPRYALQDFQYNGYRIPANTPVVVSALYTHYMPEYWTKPYKFDPLRFSPERSEDKKDFFQYVPFGGGAHKCLGLHFAQVQSKLFLFHLLKQYRISKHPGMTKYNFNSIPLTFPTDGLPLKFERIQKS